MHCPRHSNTMIMANIGGGLVISAAALVSIGIVNLSEPSYSIEIGTNTSNISNVSNGGKRSIPLNSQSLTLGPSESPSYNASMSPSHSSTGTRSYSPSTLPTLHLTAEPTIVSTTIKPTITPSMTLSSNPTDKASNFPSVAPTNAPIPCPTYKPSKSATTLSTALPLNLKSSSRGEESFRLRLHWEEGHLWQEQAEEKWWCMSCLTNCNESEFRKKCTINPKKQCQEGGALVIVDCQPGKARKKFKDGLASEFQVVHSEHQNLFDSTMLQGDMIQLVDTDLCLTNQGRDIVLKRCEESWSNQRWVGFDKSKPMELHALGLHEGDGLGRMERRQKCMTQHHHPRKGERIYSAQCGKARRAKTNLWVTF